MGELVCVNTPPPPPPPPFNSELFYILGVVVVGEGLVCVTYPPPTTPPLRNFLDFVGVVGGGEYVPGVT